MSEAPSKQVAVLGWSVIGIIGIGATMVSACLACLLVLVLDVFTLQKGPVTTEYLTVLGRKGEWAVSTEGTGGGTYEVQNARGVITTAHLPWEASAGDRVMLRHHRTKLLGLEIPAEAPVLCRGQETCPKQ